MSRNLDAVHEFGDRLGLDGFTLNSQGVAQLQFPGGVVLAMEIGREEMLVYTVHEVPFMPAGQWVDALKRCHVRRRGAWPIQVGCRVTPSGWEIVVLTRLSEWGLTPQRLEEAAQSVLQWRDSWFSGEAR